MEHFATDLDSVTCIIEQGVILEHRCVLIDCLVQVYGYDGKGRNCRRFLKYKLTERYYNQLFFETVELSRLVMIISRVSWVSQSISKVLDKTIILKQTPAILKEKANPLVKKAPDVSLSPTVDELNRHLEHLQILFGIFTSYPLKILIIVVHMISLIVYQFLPVKICCLQFLKRSSVLSNTFQ